MGDRDPTHTHAPQPPFKREQKYIQPRGGNGGDHYFNNINISKGIGKAK